MNWEELLKQYRQAKGMGFSEAELAEWVLAKTGFPLTEAQIAQKVKDGMPTIGRAVQSLGSGLSMGLSDNLDPSYATYRAANPVLAGAGEVAGGMLLGGPLGKLGRAAIPAIGKMGPAAAAAAEGAFAGGVEGGVRGAQANGVQGAAIGALGGATVGAVVPGAMRLAAPLVSPRLAASDRVRAALLKSMGGVPGVEADATRMVRAGRGEQMTLADVTPRLLAEADYAANRNPDVAARAVAQADARRAGRGDRMIEDVRQTFGRVPSAGVDEAARKATVQQTGDAVYDPLRALTQPMATSAEDVKQISEILGRPILSRVAGFRAMLDDVAGRSEGPLSSEQLMDVRQRMRRIRKAEERAGRVDAAKALDEADAALTNYMQRIPGLDRADEAYAAANQVARVQSEALDWFNAADREAVRAAYARLRGNREALDAVRGSVAAKLVESINTSPTATLAMLEKTSPKMMSNLRIMFDGKKGLEDYLDRAWAERRMLRTDDVLGNSATMRRQSMDEYSPAGAVGDAIGKVATAPLAAASVLSRPFMRQRTAEHLWDLLSKPGAENTMETIRRLGAPPKVPFGGAVGGAAGSSLAQMIMGKRN